MSTDHTHVVSNGKRELTAIEEETGPDFILERVETEKHVKEAMSA